MNTSSRFKIETPTPKLNKIIIYEQIYTKTKERPSHIT